MITSPRAHATCVSVSGFAGTRPASEVRDRREQLLPTRRIEAIERREERVSVLPEWHNSLFNRAVQNKSDGAWYWTPIILHDFLLEESTRIAGEWRRVLAEAFPV